MHLISWQKLCQPKKEGGLNIARLQQRNGAMLGKWWWRMQTERRSMWYKTMVKLYGRNFEGDMTLVLSGKKTSPML